MTAHLFVSDRLQATLAGAYLCLGMGIGFFLPSPHLAMAIIGLTGATIGIISTDPKRRQSPVSRSIIKRKIERDARLEQYVRFNRL